MINVSDNCKIFTDNIEPQALDTVYKLDKTGHFEDIRIMPDVHQGTGDTVIGFTSKLGEVVSPALVGVDIGCTVSTYITDTKVNPEEYPLIEHRIRKEIPFGMNINDKSQIDDKEFFKFMRNGLCNIRFADPYCDEDTISDICDRIGMDEGRFYKSLGTVGGGNHFIEIGVTPEGNYAYTIHTGSRNFGARVCNFWETVATKPTFDKERFKFLVKQAKKNTVDKRKLPELIKALKQQVTEEGQVNGYLTGAKREGYLQDMAIAQLYALYNHHVISSKIAAILKKINGAKVIEIITSTHNYIDLNDCIIRKGAIRAYEEHKLLIPLNMRDGIAVCIGKSNPDWNCSANHGSGRAKSRNQAKATIPLTEFKKQMEGIYSTSVCEGTLDEAPDAYKDSEEIIELIKPTCEVLYFIKPVINLKSISGDG